MGIISQIFNRIKSRVIIILDKIKDSLHYNEEPESRSEDILKSIANNTPYTAAPQSRFEDLLIKYKNGQTTTMQPETGVEEIMTAIINGAQCRTDFNSELEESLYNSLNTEPQQGVWQIDDIVYAADTPTTQNREVVQLL